MKVRAAVARYVLAFALVSLASLHLRAQVAYDVFIKFGMPSGGAAPYQGESTDAQFQGREGWSELLSVSHGALHPTSFAAGTNVTNTSFSELSLLKFVDVGSPALFQTCARGGHYDAVQLVFRRGGPATPENPPFSVAKLGPAFITAIRTSGAQGAGLPTEQITFVYGALQWTHRTVDGSGLNSVTVNWDVVLNDGGAGPLPGITLSPNSLPDATVGKNYLETFSAAGGTPPYSYHLYAGALPPGLTLTSAGVLAGTPTTTGTFNFRIAGMDDNACFDERRYVLTVANLCGARPRLLSITGTNGTVRFRLQGTTGCQYQIQSAPSVTGPWSNLGAPFTLSGTGSFEFTDAQAPNLRFYRAIVVP